MGVSLHFLPAGSLQRRMYMNKKNTVDIEERDEWSAFGEFLAGIFAKYSDEVGLDDSPAGSFF